MGHITRKKQTHFFIRKVTFANICYGVRHWWRCCLVSEEQLLLMWEMNSYLLSEMLLVWKCIPSLTQSGCLEMCQVFSFFKLASDLCPRGSLGWSNRWDMSFRKTNFNCKYIIQHERQNCVCFLLLILKCVVHQQAGNQLHHCLVVPC